MKKIIALTLLISLSSLGFTQETALSNTTLTTCEGFIVDTGMTAGDYSPNENITMTVCSDSDTIINLFFNLFSAGNGDTLTIYDGSDTDADLIGSYTQYSLNQTNVTSTNSEGCLTLVWTSDASDEGNITAEITCEAPCIPPIVAVTSNSDTTHTIRTCPGDTIMFDASGTTFAGDAILSSFTWNFMDGTTDNTSWPIINHVFNEPGGYLISLHVTDDTGCNSTNTIDILILVSTYPEWGQPETIDFCVGEGILLATSESIATASQLDSNYQGQIGSIFIAEDTGTGYSWDGTEWVDMGFVGGVDIPITTSIFEYEVSPVPFEFNFGGLGGGYLFIPDDQTTCFEDTVNVAGFAPGATLDNVDLIESLFINFEHSYMGDLTITFICPNNQAIAVHQQGGGSTNLGTPDQGDGTGPGTGFDYWWTPDAENGTWADNAQDVLPSGTYESAMDFSSLIGCPVNGLWTVQICDSWGADDGYIFDWHIEFDSTLFPAYVGTAPIYGMNCDSTFFESEFFNQNEDDCSLNWINAISEAGEFPIIITTTNDFGCVFHDSLSFFVYDDPIANAGIDQAICAEGEEIQLDGSSYQENAILGEYSYEWIPSVFIDNDSILNPVLNDDAQGSLTYYLMVSPVDHPACYSIDSVNIQIYPTPTPFITIDGFSNVICSNSEVLLSVGDQYENYEWNENPNLDTNTLSVGEGSHIVTVSYHPDCPVSDTVTISYFPIANFVNHTVCDDDFLLIEDNVENMPGEWTYVTNTDGELDFYNPFGSNSGVENSEPGIYSATFTDPCNISSVITLNFLPEPTNEDFGIEEEYEICADEAPLLIYPVGEHVNSFSWQWTTTEETISDESAAVLFETNDYTYTVSNSCGSISEDIILNVIDCNLIIPNIFTPNQTDTLNNSLVFKNLELFPNSKLLIFNRWGVEIYQSSDYLNNWSPREDEVAEGTYYYILEVPRVSGNIDKYSGYVQLLR